MPFFGEDDDAIYRYFLSQRRNSRPATAELAADQLLELRTSLDGLWISQGCHCAVQQELRVSMGKEQHPGQHDLPGPHPRQ
jgi:hypothetical protein